VIAEGSNADPEFAGKRDASKTIRRLRSRIFSLSASTFYMAWHPKASGDSDLQRWGKRREFKTTRPKYYQFISSARRVAISPRMRVVIDLCHSAGAANPGVAHDQH
jgi:hypothetical protein